MAVKNTAMKDYNVSFDKICNALRCEDFIKCLAADLTEEVILGDAREFRYVRKTDIVRYYGRNYFVKVTPKGEDSVNVAVTTQSRKVTVLFDTAWKTEVDKIFAYIDLLIR